MYVNLDYMVPQKNLVEGMVSLANSHSYITASGIQEVLKIVKEVKNGDV
jgi:hypothetical protein